jgi:hypothetical protein
VSAQAGQILVHHHLLTVVVRSFANLGESPGEELGGHPPQVKVHGGRCNKALTNRLPNPKFFLIPLELFCPLQIFLIAAGDAAGVPIGPRESRRAPEGVRCQLVPNLLFGGLGYEV